MRQFLKHHVSKDIKSKMIRAERIVKLFSRPFILRDLHEFNQKKDQLIDDRFSTDFKNIFPISGENTKYTSFDRHYVYHTSWAARVVKAISDNSPSKKEFKHTDISSSLYFSGLVSAFVPVDFYDYRPADLRLDGLTTQSGDLMNLPFKDETVESISCMHTIEHVGLGRYGDPIDPLGDVKAIKELMRVVSVNGNLLLVMPVGKQRIEFNAHRIYNPSYIKELVCKSGEFELKEYAFIPETNKEGGLERNTSIIKGRDSEYACGCFWFVRKNSAPAKTEIKKIKVEEVVEEKPDTAEKTIDVAEVVAAGVEVLG